MKAFALESFEHPPEWVEVPDPDPGAGEVLVRVVASSVNGADIWVAMGAMKDFARYDFPVIVGKDFAGVVEAVGPRVGRFAVGDEVLGFFPGGEVLREGAFAALLTVPEDAHVARKPSALGSVEAGALPLAGATAIQAVGAIDAAAGQVVLIIGATGGVGCFAVQLAARAGANVIATGLPDDEEYLLGLGASEIVDYSHDVGDQVRARHPAGIDAIVDMTHRDSAELTALASLVRRGGRVASTVSGAEVEKLGTEEILATNVMGAADPADVGRVAELAGSGEVRVPIQRVYAAADVARALEDFTAEHTVGKLAIDLGGGA